MPYNPLTVLWTRILLFLAHLLIVLNISRTCANSIKSIDMKSSPCFYNRNETPKVKVMNVHSDIKKVAGKKLGIKRWGLPIALRTFVLY